MELLKYIILGVLQGFTEPLPISSSGHIFILKAIFNSVILEDINLEIFLNFASFIAIFIIFRKDILSLIKGTFEYIKTGGKKSKEIFNYLLMIIVGTVPVGVLGILLKGPMERILSKNIFLVGFGFIITGLSLLLVINSNGKKKDKDITFKDAIIIGLFQAISIVPGISRSGLTLVAALLRGLDKKTAIKYTFMLYFPVSIASMLIGIKDFSSAGLEMSMILYYFAGMISAGILTFVSYNWLTKLVENGKLWKFSIYLFAIALFTIMFFI